MKNSSGRSLKLEIERFDTDLVLEKYKSYLEQIEELSKAVDLKTWELGRILYEATKDMTNREKTYFYSLIYEELGISRNYLREARMIYSRIRDYPELVKKGIKSLIL